MSKPFNWRDYIEVDNKFGKDKALIEKALDGIAQAAPDGEELIKKAYALNPHHKKLNIQVFENHLSILGVPDKHSNADSMVDPGTIQLDMQQVRMLSFVTSQGKKEHASLTGILVHEMFHLADFNNAANVKLYKGIEQLIQSQHLNHDQKEAVLKAVSTEMTEAMKHAHFSKKGDPAQTMQSIENKMLEVQDHIMHSPAILKRLAAEAHVAPGSFHFGAVGDDISSPGVYKKNGQLVIAKREADATAYTDVFMAKHFIGEPWRGSYLNGSDEKPIEPIVRKLTEGNYIPTVYEPESVSLGKLGHLSQPSIEKTFHLKGLTETKQR